MWPHIGEQVISEAIFFFVFKWTERDKKKKIFSLVEKWYDF